MSDSINILDLPDIVLENILNCLTYDEIAKNRLVCKKFDSSCKSLLNRGFVVVERRQSLVSRTIRHCLPRRESERRAHPLARHCEILSALETRISMLSMTFMKFIDTGLCCFIPGKVIDEILHILRVVQKSTSPPRTHDLLQELRDISSMAMEHFEEFIVPSLRLADANTSVCKSLFQSAGLKRTGRRSPILVSDLIRREFKTINHNTKIYRQQLCGMKKLMSKLNQKVKTQDSLITYQACKLRKQRRLLQDQSNCISDIKKSLEECDRKISDLTSEFNRNRDKPMDTKASQTNEGKKAEPYHEFDELSALFKDFDEPTKKVLNDINKRLSLPSFKIPFDSIKGTTTNDNNNDADDDDDDSDDIDGFIQRTQAIIASTFHSYPARRTTLSDFRLNNRLATPTLSSVAAPTTTTTTTDDPPTNCSTKDGNSSRKRKVIDIIADVVDSKTPSKPIDKAEITQLLRKYPRLNNDDDHHYYFSPSSFYDNDTSTDKVKGKRRLQRYADVSDEIPSKRLLGKFRQI